MRQRTWKTIGVPTAIVLLALGVGILPEPPAEAQEVPDAQPELADLLLTDGLTRQEMAGLNQALAPAQDPPPACVAGQEMFTDVPATHPFCSWIEELARRGITGGCTATEYCPGNPVNRAQMAAFMVRAMDATAELATHWINVYANGTIRSHSKGLEGVLVLRPVGVPIGTYCIFFPDGVNLQSEAAVGSVQEPGGAHGHRGITVTATIGSSCNALGQWDVTVQITDNEAAADAPFIVLIPGRRG